MTIMTPRALPLALPAPRRGDAGDLLGAEPRFTVQVCRSLSHLGDAALDRITERSSVFFDRRWLRMIEALDLSALAGGEVDLRFAVAWRGPFPVAVCPFLVTRSRSVHLFYSLEKFFFTPWWTGGVAQHAPDQAGRARWASRAVSTCGVLARALRAGVGGWVLAVSPLSHRAGVALAPMFEAEAREVRDAIVAQLQAVAVEENLPLCFLGLQEDERELRPVLAARGFEEVFVAYDNRLELECESFEGYLARFKSDARRLFNREMKQAKAAGVTFQRTRELSAHADDLDRLYRATSSKYSDDHFAQPPAFWAELERHLGARAEAVLALGPSGVSGFSLLLHKGEDLWFHRVGRTYDGAADAAVYFNLAFYEPVKRALELGAKRIWLGFGTWEAKRRRGARAHAISSAFWFPGRWSRSLLLPYLRTFGRLSQSALASLAAPCSYLKTEEAA